MSLARGGDQCGAYLGFRVTLPDLHPARSICDFDYVLELAGGQLPPGLALPATIGAWCTGPVEGGLLVVESAESRTQAWEPVAFELRVSAADRSGRRGPATTVAVQHPGEPMATAAADGGCSVGRGPAPRPGGLVPWLLAPAFVLRRRLFG